MAESEATASGLPTPKSLAGVLLGLAPLGFAAFLFFVDLPLCPARALFGVPCPGCGLTRATRAMFSLDVAGVWSAHPMAPVVTPMVAWTLLRLPLVYWGVIDRRQWDLFRWLPPWFWKAFLALFLGVWIARLASGLHPDPLDPASGSVTGWLF